MNPLSLRAKIFVGFASIIMLLIVKAWIAQNSMQQLVADVQHSQQVAQTHAEVLTFDRDVQELRQQIDSYINIGTPSIRRNVRELHRRLLARVKLTRETADQPFHHPLEQISSHIQKHGEQFETVVIERDLRTRLLRKELPAKSESIVSEMERRLKQVSDLPNEDLIRLRLTESLSDFTRAEMDLLRYFRDPDSTRITSSLASLQRSRKSYSAIVGEEDSLVDSTSNSILDFRRTALRAVQATRSYLFLRNVVMAGEASEITFYSRKLRELADDQSAAINQQISWRTKWINNVAAISIALAVVVAAIIAIRLVLLIVPPIRQLTVTFRALASGAVLEQIPGSERQDEIGQMANAARVFSQQNQTTVNLLADSKKMSEQLRTQKQQLEHANQTLELTNQELDSFAYVASHDLKSPLRGVRQLAHWIEEDLDNHFPGRTQEYLTHLNSRIKKMETLLDDLLDFSRVGRSAPVVEFVDTKALVQEAVELIDNPKNVRVELANDLPQLSTVVAPLEHTLINLIGNAIKYHDKDSDGWVKVGYIESEDKWRFCVTDNGPGIDPKHHERVFQMYQRVNFGGVEGSGMGLAIVKKQVEYMGGQIHVESDLGLGSTFSFTWPKSSRYVNLSGSEAQS